MVEYFHDGVSSNLVVFPPHISLNIREFDFGCCARLQTVDPLPLSLTNHTKGKITVIWTNKTESPFQVIPECCDVPPLKSMAFRITFQPPQLNSLYAAELEGFAFYKVGGLWLRGFDLSVYHENAKKKNCFLFTPWKAAGKSCVKWNENFCAHQ